MGNRINLVDCLAITVLLAVVSMYLLLFEAELDIPDGLPILTHNALRYAGDDGTAENESSMIPLRGNPEQHFQDAPICQPLEYHDVTFSLAIALREENISMVTDHCKRWGVSAPISIAVWTYSSPEEVMKQLNECHPEQMTIATLIPSNGLSSVETYPLNTLRNLAIQGIKTTHAIYLDIKMLTSIDLFDTLHAPPIVRELARNPRLAVVLPAFEVITERCSFRGDCLENIPTTFDGLVMQLSEKTTSIMASHDKALQGSTRYRTWVNQANGELVDIQCVASDYYEPFLAFRYCRGLPPFQEVLSRQINYIRENAEGSNEDTEHDRMSTWIIHLLRLGYAFKQVGGGFVVHLPNVVASNSITRQLRKKKVQQKFERNDFLEWLHRTIPDHRTMQRCSDILVDGDLA